jgi:phage terminase small subunit
MAKSSEDRLTIRQELFLSEYLKDRNATQAALRAGYSPKSAITVGFNNVRHPVIAAKIRENTEKAKAVGGVDPAFVIEQLKRVAEQDDVAQSTKVRALELLAKHLGMLEDRLSIKTDGLSSEQRAERVAILLERVSKRD